MLNLKIRIAAFTLAACAIVTSVVGCSGKNSSKDNSGSSKSESVSNEVKARESLQFFCDNCFKEGNGVIWVNVSVPDAVLAVLKDNGEYESEVDYFNDFIADINNSAESMTVTVNDESTQFTKKQLEYIKSYFCEYFYENFSLDTENVKVTDGYEFQLDMTAVVDGEEKTNAQKYCVVMIEGDDDWVFIEAGIEDIEEYYANTDDSED